MHDVEFLSHFSGSVCEKKSEGEFQVYYSTAAAVIW